jgi:ATP adenylyltransferase
MSAARLLIPGQLWSHVVRSTERAIQSGHLQPIPTHDRLIAQDGAEWLLRIIDHSRHKPRAETAPNDFNPFLPYDPAMHVADLSTTHVGLLNKFNVVPHHLLIITRQFESQDSPLTRADFQALWICLAEYNSLGFYNAGAFAGASQRHKHLQTVPLPLHDRLKSPVPLEPLLELDGLPAGQIGPSERLPFGHLRARLQPRALDRPDQAAAESYELYCQMLEATGHRNTNRLPPYNLLVTRTWMLFVPRRQECFQQISLNALAFAGALLAKNQPQLDQLLTPGPLHVLQQVTFPRDLIKF